MMKVINQAHTTMNKPSLKEISSFFLINMKGKSPNDKHITVAKANGNMIVSSIDHEIKKESARKKALNNNTYPKYRIMTSVLIYPPLIVC
jgi:hypothetical protein